MDTGRQWYLYKQVRPFCKDENKEDEVATMPKVPYKPYAEKRTAEKKEKKKVVDAPTEKKKRGRPAAPMKSVTSTPKSSAKVASSKKKLR